MSNFQNNREKRNIKLQRFENRFLYFLSFKSPLTSAYSNRALTNYVNIIVARDRLIQEKKIEFLLFYLMTLIKRLFII
jgi:RNA recognition motif-containing protein